MSATNRGEKLATNENYPTPPWCVHRLLEAVELPGGVWLEPCAGEGAIIKAVDDVRADVIWRANEIRQTTLQLAMSGLLEAQITIGDVLAYDRWNEADVILTNPPFSLAAALAAKALLEAPETPLVMLQRVNWFAASRADMIRVTRPSFYGLPNRPSFVGKGTDATEYGWFVWNAGPEGVFRVLRDTPLEERRR